MSIFKVTELHDGKGRLCREILATLPQWFGIPEAVNEYVEEAEHLPMLIAMTDVDEIAGFISLKQQTWAAFDAYVLGFKPRYHRQGGGRILFDAAADYARRNGARFLTVKTVSQANPDPYYAETRLFYEKIGFLPLEVFPTLWNEANPCLLMVKLIDG